MFQQAKWLGLSLALHLVAVGSLISAGSRTAERAPKAIEVVLDNHAPAEVPLRKVVQPSPPTAARRADPSILGEPAKPEMRHQLFQPAVPQVSPAIPSPERSRSSGQSKAAEAAAASTGRTRGEEVGSAPDSPAKAPVPHPVPAAEERPTQEKAQQRYQKAHFTYIRDLVTRQLAYPPMARRMHWSGKVVVAFVIAEDGTVHNIRVVESSGFPILDKSATETVRNVAPFPKPPVRADILLPISFKMMEAQP